jgi:hypothetical protein
LFNKEQVQACSQVKKEEKTIKVTSCPSLIIMWVFLGHGTFSAKTGKVPGKPGVDYLTKDKGNRVGTEQDNYYILVEVEKLTWRRNRDIFYTPIFYCTEKYLGTQRIERFINYRNTLSVVPLAWPKAKFQSLSVAPYFMLMVS